MGLDTECARLLYSFLMVTKYTLRTISTTSARRSLRQQEAEPFKNVQHKTNLNDTENQSNSEHAVLHDSENSDQME